jgi:S1-C subfamily serine protease
MDEELNQRPSSALEVRGVVVLRAPAGKLAPRLQESTPTRDGSIFLGDIIAAVNGKPVETLRQLALQLDELRVGDAVSLSLLRKGKPLTLEACPQAGN